MVNLPPTPVVINYSASDYTEYSYVEYQMKDLEEYFLKRVSVLTLDANGKNFFLASEPFNLR